MGWPSSSDGGTARSAARSHVNICQPGAAPGSVARVRVSGSVRFHRCEKNQRGGSNPSGSPRQPRSQRSLRCPLKREMGFQSGGAKGHRGDSQQRKSQRGLCPLAPLPVGDSSRPSRSVPHGKPTGQAPAGKSGRAAGSGHRAVPCPLSAQPRLLPGGGRDRIRPRQPKLPASRSEIPSAARANERNRSDESFPPRAYFRPPF